jgi:hypothetical protein
MRIQELWDGAGALEAAGGSEVDAVVRLRAKRARPVLPDVAQQRPPQPVRDRVPVVGPRRPGDIVFLIAFISLVL